MKKLLAFFSCVIFFITSFGYAQNQILPQDQNLVIGTLDNGMKYYIKQNKKPEKRAELYLLVNAGSVLENEDQLGLAHFVEHMAFNGTKNFKKNDLINYLESIGIKFGPELNAYTSFDQTVYMLTVPTDSTEILSKGFLVLEDWAHNLSFDPLEIDKERGVIIEEWRLGRGAQMRMLDKQLPILFKDSKYASRLPIGKKEIIESFDHKVLIDFYKDWYRPDLMAIAAVGDFDVKEIEGYIKSHFEKINYPDKIRQREISPVPEHNQTYFAIASDKEAIYSMIVIYYKHKAKSIKTIDEYKNAIIHQLFYMMLNDRLSELTSMADPPFNFSNSGENRFVKGVDLSVLAAMVNEGGIPKGFEALLTEAERVRKHGFTVTEFERTKANRMRILEKRLDEKDKTESRSIMQDFVQNFIYDSPILGIENVYELNKELIPQISLEEVNKVATELMKEDNRVVMITSPEKNELVNPTEDELNQIVKIAANKKIEPYVDAVEMQPLVEKMPQSSPIIETKQIHELGVTEWKLANGVRVVIKPTDFKNDEILFTAFSPGGSSLADDPDFMSANHSADIVSESGLGNFSKTELDKYLKGKIASVYPFVGFYEEGLNGNTSPKDLETFFQLIYSYFTQARNDTTAFLSYKSAMLAWLKNMSNEPTVIFNDTLQYTAANYHFRSRPLSVKLLDEIDLNKSINIFKDRFADASDFTFVFVGNIDLNTFKPFVETYLGGLPSINRGEKIRDLKYVNVKGERKKEVHKGIEQKSSVGYAYVGDMIWNRKNEHILESLINVLDIKLREAIREEKGGTYGISIWKEIYMLPNPHYTIRITFGCAPDRVQELISSVSQVIDSIKMFGPDAIVLNKVKEIQRKQRELHLKENSFWKGILSNYLQYNDNPVELLDYYKWVDALTADDIKKAINFYINKDVVEVVLYPETIQ